MVLFHVLGPLEVHSGAGRQLGRGKPATLLATLLVQPNRWVPVNHLIETTWQEQAAPASAEANLKTYVWRLRRLLPGHDGGSRIESRPGAYRLRVGPGELDAQRAGDLAAEARALAAGGDAVTAAERLEQALRLWRGRPFEGLDAVVPAEAVARLDALQLDLRERLAELRLGLGGIEQAVALLRAVTAADPLREDAWARLVRALHALGQRAEALAAYRRARAVLAGELGVAPGPALTDAYRATLGAGRADQPRRELPRDVPLTGRTEELAAVARAATGTASVVLVEGMAGVGRTAFAVHAAHRLAPRYPDGQFFVRLDAGGAAPPDPYAVLDRLLRGLGVAPADVPADPDERAALWRSELSGRRVLLVLDDVPDGDYLAPLLPAAPGCLTLLTTRHRGWHPDGATRIGLAPLGERDGAAMIRAALAERAVDAADPAVAALVRRCGGLPAALRDAAARLRTRPHWTVRRLLDELDQDPCRILSAAVRRSITEPVRRMSGVELVAWRALGVLPGEFGSVEAARTLGTAVATARVALEALVDRGLLEAVAPDTYRCHVLIRHLVGCAEQPARPARAVRPARSARDLRPAPARVA